MLPRFLLMLFIRRSSAAARFVAASPDRLHRRLCACQRVARLSFGRDRPCTVVGPSFVASGPECLAGRQTLCAASLFESRLPLFRAEPGNSTLVAYVLELPNGKRETGRIPNWGIRPRLLYHRHFMLTEFLAASENYPPAVRTELLRAMARELCHEHGALRVTLSKVTHRLPSMERIRAGGTLDDNYTEEPLGTFSCDGM